MIARRISIEDEMTSFTSCKLIPLIKLREGLMIYEAADDANKFPHFYSPSRSMGKDFVTKVAVDGSVSDKRKALLAMNFSTEEIDSAMNFLGGEASMRDILDFIVTAQTAGSSVQKDAQEFALMNTEEVTINSTVDKEHALLEMGYSKEEVSDAIRILGANASILDLADSIFAKQVAETAPQDYLSPQDASLEAKMEMLQNVAVTALL